MFRAVSSERPMSLDPTWIFLSMIPGGIGFVLFVYGKKQQRLPHLAAGILLMAYPYFTQTMLSLFGVGAVICVALWYVVRLGW
jgi:predicted PurR-regulated permease PerM